MSNTEESFRSGYGKLVAATWADPSLVAQLKADPVSVLGNYGISVVPGAVVRVVELVPTGSGSFDEQWADWEKGDSSGKYELWLPSKPSTAEVSAAADTATTCTPCCTCT